MKTRAVAFALLCAGLSSSVGCGQVDLAASLTMEELSSGYYDAGVTELGANKLVPSLTFRLKNTSAESINAIDLVVFFWGTEFDQPKELDEIILRAVDSEGLAPNAATEPIVIRSKQGFALEQQARTELFNHRLFRDVTAKVFLKRGGRIVPFGEYTIERRLLLAPPTGPAAQ